MTVVSMDVSGHRSRGFSPFRTATAARGCSWFRNGGGWFPISDPSWSVWPRRVSLPWRWTTTAGSKPPNPMRRRN